MEGGRGEGVRPVGKGLYGCSGMESSRAVDQGR